MRNVPFSLIINDELEHAMPVWRTERNRVFSRSARHRGKGCTDVRVEHRELKLKVV